VHGNSFNNFYCQPSVWNGFEHNVALVIDNSTRQIGNGQRVNFWLDKWLTIPIVDWLGVPNHSHNTLEAKNGL